MPQEIPPAVNGTEQRLDALYGRLGDILDALQPAIPPDPAGRIELREPAGPVAEDAAAAGDRDGTATPLEQRPVRAAARRPAAKTRTKRGGTSATSPEEV